MARALLVLVMVTGCGFQLGIGADGAPADDARDADIADGDIDAPAPTTCLGKWQAHQVAFSTPSLLANIPTAGQQGDPAMTSDELVLFFVWDGDLFADHDIWAAIRPSLTDPFGESGIKSSISDLVSEDSKLSVNGDGLIGVIASQRFGTVGGWDLFEARRSASGNAVFETISPASLFRVNDTNTQLDPHISADGLHVYYAAGDPQQIWVAARAGIDDSFAIPEQVAGIASNGGDGNADPTLSPDETVIVFTSNRTAPQALTNLWYATRTSTGTFGTPQMVPDVNSSGYDGDPFLSPDGCRLYFASTRGSTSDLYVAEMQ